MKKNLRKYLVLKDSSIREAVKVMDSNGKGVVIIIDELGKLLGILTDGDFRRAVLKGVNLNKKALDIATKNFIYVERDYSVNEAKKIFLREPIKHLPVLDEGYFIDLLLKEELFYKKETQKDKDKLKDIPVVIMAGGEGKRLDPFTKILPKALVPVENKPMLDYILEQFKNVGIKKFFISINFKGSLIKIYVKDSYKNLDISFVEEKKPLGTAGALRYLERKIDRDFIVSNCDILVNTDYNSVIKYHTENKNLLTIIGASKNFVIPYGVCKTNEKGELLHFDEKPRFDNIVNTGVYVLSPKLLGMIPKNKFFDMTDLINLLLSKKERIGIFPVSEHSWVDVGEWEKYRDSYEILREKLRE